MKLIASLTLLTALVFMFSKSVLAIGAVPDFPSCANPSGELKVRYESGTHAVIGDLRSFNGKDEVYWLEGGIALQCLCPSFGEGIQTNWWNVAGITQNEIDSYKSQGWYFVPSGSEWGLLADPYLAKNTGFSCKGESSSVGGIGGGSTSSVLGLAQTGDNATYIALIGLGLAFISGGLLLKKK